MCSSWTGICRVCLRSARSPSLMLPRWTHAEPSHTAEVLWCTYHGQSPQTSAGWQSGVEWLTAQDKLSRYNLELLNLSQTQREGASGQSVSLCLFKSVSLSLFLSFRQLNLAANFLVQSDKKQKKNRNLYVCVLTGMFGCFTWWLFKMSLRGWESGQRLGHSSL